MYLAFATENMAWCFGALVLALTRLFARVNVSADPSTADNLRLWLNDGFFLIFSHFQAPLRFNSIKRKVQYRLIEPCRQIAIS
jgi:hypothetical protein